MTGTRMEEVKNHSGIDTEDYFDFHKSHLLQWKV